MSAITSLPEKAAIIYPESDGLPMADNTKQFRWITTVHGGLDAMFRHEQMVFVAANLLWYPVEGNPTIRAAPDILVAFNRPKGDRGSYLQWLEANIALRLLGISFLPGIVPAS